MTSPALAHPVAAVVAAPWVIHGRRWVVVLAAFSCFFPYPAVAVGGSTGVQMSQLLLLGLLPIAVYSDGLSRPAVALLALIATSTATGFIALLADPLVAPDLVVKSLAVQVLSFSAIVSGGWLVRQISLARILTAVSAALLVHGFVSLLQWFSFRGNAFPLLTLYQNPSFSPIEPIATRLATYDKRPFALFPEPSAMTASIGPWLVLMLGVLAHPGLRAALSRTQARWLIAGLLAASSMLVLGRSGNSAFIAGGLAAVAGHAAYERYRGGAWSRSSGLRLALGVLTALPLVGLAGYGLVDRFTRTGSGIESWSDRVASIIAGLSFLGDGVREMIFGLGPGQSEAAIIANGINSGGSIWSDAGRYLAEAGTVGAGALLLVLGLAVVAVSRSNARTVGAACLAVWIASVTLATSYIELSSLWLFLGALLVWDRLFPRAAGSAPLKREE